MNLEYEFLKSTLCSIIENIELWENSLIYKYSDCLVKIIRKLDKEISISRENNEIQEEILLNGIINIIFRFFLNIIENSDTEISFHYIKGFDEIINTLYENKRTIIESDIIDNVCIMGSFGKKNLLRRFSLFFCTSFIRVNL